MADRTAQRFGGAWTQQKLEVLRKYLSAYVTIMSKQSFRFAYIDAFAGTGYRESPKKPALPMPMFPELNTAETISFYDGSARIALEIKPAFHRYFFIDDSHSCCEELAKLKTEYPQLADRIEIVNADCNSWLQDICLHRQWKMNRAVLFLDPFGMSVQWKTMEAIAHTKALDVIILFPLGVAVNRLLKKDGYIRKEWVNALNQIFGTGDWYPRFYKINGQQSMFSEDPKVRKIGDLSNISRYYVERLRTIFPKDGVATNPMPLCNIKGNPLFHLCFAAGNPKGAKTAVKIANDLLQGWPHGS
jgi:three-Cys-motif partner protein